jgi:hypothetical protein
MLRLIVEAREDGVVLAPEALAEAGIDAGASVEVRFEREMSASEIQSCVAERVAGRGRGSLSVSVPAKRGADWVAEVWEADGSERRAEFTLTPFGDVTREKWFGRRAAREKRLADQASQQAARQATDEVDTPWPS